MYTIVIIPYKDFFYNYISIYKGKYRGKIHFAFENTNMVIKKQKFYEIYSERVFTNLFFCGKILLKIKEVRYGQKSTPYR